MKSLDEMTLEQVSEWLRNHMTNDMMRETKTGDLMGLESILSHWQQIAAYEIRERTKR